MTLEGDAPRRPEVQATPQPPVVDAAQILASRDHTVARLAAAPSPGEDDSSSNLRRRAVSASTREIRYASYLAAWTRKVERIGNINYPQAAKEQRIYGSLLLHVSIRADGSLAQVRVVRSSGYDLLDQAAVRIVELAAPFAPFPPDIAAETDVLDIIRNWQFMRGDTLGWEH
ncbi:energy transducer TonB [Marichromatium bheemlicum]|uniref:Energy transducer TonB n=1 Tax=Marichromatium bheemlicum TaxID=365339 RepID=A0ABX1I742_9GAMM|nr:energy transducer TonB [Marichromatium bheemlicum]